MVSSLPAMVLRTLDHEACRAIRHALSVNQFSNSFKSLCTSACTAYVGPSLYMLVPSPNSLGMFNTGSCADPERFVRGGPALTKLFVFVFVFLI